MNPKNTITATLILLCSLAQAQVIQRIDPPFWYHNLGSDTVSLLLYGNFKTGVAASFTSSTAGVDVIDPKIKVEDGYHIVQLVLKDTQVHTIDIQCNMGKAKQGIQYQVYAHPGKVAPVQASDVMYLIMPDRFANGDARNDNAPGMLEKANREQIDGRHGGDIKGIQNHLDYIKSLGVNSLWLTPVLENNQPRQSYHGYACTDHYRIDPRFGTNTEYISLTQSCAAQDIKIVLDVVYNHCGSEHGLYKKPVQQDWFHRFDSFTRSNYRIAALTDPYAAPSEQKKMLNGWFDHHMPDINQSNPLVQQYLIQNTLWWMAQTKASALRIDTYPYSDATFLEALRLRVKQAFPESFIFGETWEHSLVSQAHFAPGMFESQSTSTADAVTDFQTCFTLQQALTEPFGWNTGLSRLYYLNAGDKVYSNPNYLVTFGDNHDLNRMHAQYGQNMAKTKMALTYLFMNRGIPCVFYGTELLMNDTGAHGAIRRDFPGGFPGGWDEGFNGTAKSAFLPEERDPIQQHMINYISSLSQIRAAYSPLFEAGKRMQYIPENGVYRGFIYTDSMAIGYFINQSTNSQLLPLSLFPDLQLGTAEQTDLIGLTPITQGSPVRVEPESVTVILFTY
jgi:neopullulanase